MKNINLYITEKFKITKDIEEDNMIYLYLWKFDENKKGTIKYIVCKDEDEAVKEFIDHKQECLTILKCRKSGIDDILTTYSMNRDNDEYKKELERCTKQYEIESAIGDINNKARKLV